MKKIYKINIFLIIFIITLFAGAQRAAAGSCACARTGSQPVDCYQNQNDGECQTIAADFNKRMSDAASADRYSACLYNQDSVCSGQAQSTNGKLLPKYGSSLTCGDEICYKTEKSCQKTNDCAGISGVGICDGGFCFLNQTGVDKLATGVDLPMKTPILSISWPGLKFTELKNALRLESDGMYLYIPWIGEFIASVYKFSTVIGSIIAVLMIIVEGIKIIVSGDGAEKTNSYKRILQIFTGLFLLWTSYAFLYTINPDLVRFAALKIKYIEPVNLSTLVFEGHEPAPLYSRGTGKTLSTSDYDGIFQKFASCVGIDWKILKSISYRESGLNPTIVNNLGYTGLFQTLSAYCVANMNNMKLDPALCNNPGIKDPAVNTAIGVSMIKTHLNIIKKYCSNTPARDTVFMIYFGNANGSGALCLALKKYGCNVNSWPDATWPSDVPDGCVTKGALTGKKIFLGAPRAYAHGTADLAVSQGVSSVYVSTNASDCPSVSKIMPKAGSGN